MERPLKKLTALETAIWAQAYAKSFGHQEMTIAALVRLGITHGNEAVRMLRLVTSGKLKG